MRLEKPLSLSYQESTFTRRPITRPTARERRWRRRWVRVTALIVGIPTLLALLVAAGSAVVLVIRRAQIPIVGRLFARSCGCDHGACPVPQPAPDR